jgi:NAD(P)-dependent dehydrogenase (short-subunit alcohol dehydrogenase family)
MEGLRALAGLIGGLAVYCDTSVEEDVETLAEATAAEHGPIDIAISAAGFRSWERSTPSLQI